MFAMHPTVSFVVTCYNFEAYIGECLASILAQRGTDDYEIIVIDDASADDSAAVIRSFTDPRIHFIEHTTNRGSVLSRLEGLAMARGDFVTYTCGDDRLRPCFLERTLSVMRSHSGLGMVYGDVALINSRGEIVQEVWDGIRSRPAHQGRDFQGDEFLALLVDNFIPITTVLVRRAVINEMMPFRSDLAFLDWYMNLRIAQRHPLYYLAETLAEYRIHGKNQHLRFARDTTYPVTVLRILDEFFDSPERESETRKIRSRVYASTYLEFGNRAFATNQMDHARQYYLQALRYQPLIATHPGPMRRLLGTWLGTERYNRAKALLRGSNAT